MTIPERLWEVDIARGIAISMMILSNFLFDLFFFKGIQGLYSGFWLYFARVTASLFILLVGVSLTLSYSRVKKKPGKAVVRKYVLRGARVFGYGLLITVVTWFFLGGNVILFGILHLIGLAIILSIPFLRFKKINLLLGVVIILIGFALETISVNFPWLLWLGLREVGYTTVDYVPVFPWFGLVLIGIFLGNLFFPEGKRRAFLGRGSHRVIRFLSLLGRNSLFLYLIHQPILVSVILLL